MAVIAYFLQLPIIDLALLMGLRYSFPKNGGALVLTGIERSSVLGLLRSS